MNRNKFIILASIFAVIAVTAGCGRLETYGEKISNRSITPLKDVLMHPQDYNGKTVTMKGKIKLVCETGCWFNLADGGAGI